MHTKMWKGHKVHPHAENETFETEIQFSLEGTRICEEYAYSLE